MNYLTLTLLCMLTFLFLKKIFFDTTDYKSIINDGGIIIDVCTEAEFYTGHIQNPLNIPLCVLNSKLDYLKNKDQEIINCCASVMRNEVAQKLLSAKGYCNVLNGGGWSNLESKLK